MTRIAFDIEYQPVMKNKKKIVIFCITKEFTNRRVQNNARRISNLRFEIASFNETVLHSNRFFLSSILFSLYKDLRFAVRLVVKLHRGSLSCYEVN